MESLSLWKKSLISPILMALPRYQEMKQEEDESKEGYLHRERTYSQAQRVINFPEEVNPDEVEAKMKDGILELKIMKKEPAPEERMRKVKL